jgi:hypothetical protein
MPCGSTIVFAVSVTLRVGAACVVRSVFYSRPAAKIKLRILAWLFAWPDVESIEQSVPHQTDVHWRTPVTVDANARGYFSRSVISNDNAKQVFQFDRAYREYGSSI